MIRIDPPPANNRAEHPIQGTIRWPGLPTIRVENLAGTMRRGTTSDGRQWAVRMPAHYGEFRATEGVDGDRLDVFVRPDATGEEPVAFVVHARNPDTGDYDEDKVMLGWADEDEALRVFRRAYDRGGFDGRVRRLTVDKLGAWLEARGNRGAKITAGQLVKATPQTGRFPVEVATPEAGAIVVRPERLAKAIAAGEALPLPHQAVMTSDGALTPRAEDLLVELARLVTRDFGSQRVRPADVNDRRCREIMAQLEAASDVVRDLLVDPATRESYA